MDRKSQKAMFAKGVAKGNGVMYDDGKYKINEIPMRKGQRSLEEKSKLKFLNSTNGNFAHHVGTHTANKIDWRNMNRELSDIEQKMSKLDDKELDGKISSSNYMRQHDMLDNHHRNVRWGKYSHLNSNTENGEPLLHNNKEVKSYSDDY